MKENRLAVWLCYFYLNINDEGILLDIDTIEDYNYAKNHCKNIDFYKKKDI